MARKAKIPIFAGGVLILLSLCGLLLNTWLSGKTGRNTAEVLAALDAVLPRSAPALEGTHRNPEMPVLQIENQDVIAIVEIPAFGIRLPVLGQWEQGNLLGMPRRFSGSAYDGSLIIGGCDKPGQFDCFHRIPNDTQVILTDMTGGEYTYRVSRIQRSDSAEASILADPDAKLTLFVRDTYTMEYIILRCTR